jgi:hypothetical protein
MRYSRKKVKAVLQIESGVSNTENSKPLPAPEDWDFSSCPKDELVICNYYEYARETEKLRPEAIRNSHLHDKHANREAARMSLFEAPEKRFKLQFDRLFIEFPSLPYLSIPKKLRRARHSELQNHFGAVIATNPIEAILAADSDSPFEALLKMLVGISFTKSHTAHLIVIDWSENEAAIGKAFTNLLARLRPGKVKPGKQIERRGRSSSEEQLIDLMALRLLKHFKGDYKAAMNFSAQHFEILRKPSNNNRKVWTRCVRRAEKRLKARESLFAPRRQFEMLPGFELFREKFVAKVVAEAKLKIRAEFARLKRRSPTSQPALKTGHKG